MKSSSGGSLYYPLDDNMYQNASWSLVGSYAGRVGLLYNSSVLGLGEYCVGLEVETGAEMPLT
eukprot:376033-Hanusia_phi.AAC.1